jgi:hypothetical protein
MEGKRMKKLIILAMLISFMIISVGAPVAFAAKAKTGPVTLQGTLQQSGSDYVIKSGKTTYNVEGEGLANLVGKKVIASGQMTKTDKGKMFKIDKIDEDISKKK